MQVTKAIIPVAGMGTRLLPQTKAIAKEMLPIINKPVVQYVVEEAIAGGITEIIFVVGRHKETVQDHFERNYKLEDSLKTVGKHDLAEQLEALSGSAKFTYVDAAGPYGNAMPILNAADHIGDEPFILLWADDFFISQTPRTRQLIDASNEYDSNVIAMIPIDPSESIKYGIPSIKETDSPGIFEIKGLIEKPQPQDAPSGYASVGGYLLDSKIIPIIQQLADYHEVHGGEVYLAEAIDLLCKQTKVLGKLIDGRWHDTGTKEGYLKAIVDVGLSDPQLGPAFRTYVEDLLSI